MGDGDAFGVAELTGLDVDVGVAVAVGLVEEEAAVSSLLEQALKTATVPTNNKRTKAWEENGVFIVAAFLAHIARKWHLHYGYVIERLSWAWVALTEARNSKILDRQN